LENEPLPNDVQRKQLCELMYWAFVELRYLSGEQANDLAYAFHNLPLEIYGWGNWSVAGTRARFAYFQEKHAQSLGTDYVALLDKMYPP
jgi:hypothetical protein